MPRLVDTSIRLLSQEPLAGAVPTSELLRLAALLDGAGYALLEVSGGGAFDSAVQHGVESPWERIRALKAATTTPLAIAARGHFLVGSRPVGDDLVRRFVASAAESGIDVFRLHDPLNDPDNLRVAADAVHTAGREFDAALLYGPAAHGAHVETAKALAQLGTARIVLADPAGLLEPNSAGELVGQLAEASGLPVGLYCQGAARNGLALALEAVRAGADRVACAIYAVALTTHRVSAESLAQALAGMGEDAGVDVERLWDASALVDDRLGDVPVAPIVPRVSVRAARRRLPFGLVSVIDGQLARHRAGDRLDEVLDEVERVRREAGEPPLAAPLGQIVASQALVNVLGAARYASILDELRDLVTGRFGRTPAPVDPALARAVELLPAEPASAEVDLASLRERAQGLAASEEELLLLALFGEEAEPLLRSIRARSGEEPLGEEGGADSEREERIRAVVAIVQESGVGEITVEEDGVRISVRNVAEPDAGAVGAPQPAAGELDAPLRPREESALIAISSPMVGTFYRRPKPDADAYVEEGDPVTPGQVLCILEAMKLMNEVKAEIEAIVRRIHVADGAPVEYGQLLFELEPAGGRPVGDLVFGRVLVANRGEIAVRIIRALHELGVEAVAVYSTAEPDAAHVRLADDAVCVGPPPAGESYLRIDSIVAAAVTTGCQALHPGYGFLSENPVFVEACEANDVVFIGPPADVMRSLGDKIAARRVMREAGVPTLPGTDGATTLEQARSAAAEIGYPVMLKASAGGGGRGMRLVAHPADLDDSFAAASAEAGAAFGDESVYLERVLDPARHVEVQVLCDNAGGVLTLGERECSLQRRHQKLIEETPSPAADDDLREAMELAAERACRFVGYRNAGTFEFLLGADGRFSFIELNARLQVEHPITEAATGIDIVRAQIEIAAGARLPLAGRAPRRGHAIEIRLNAEDPTRDFLPVPGTVHRFRPPLGPGVRVETFLEDGTTITPFYDSLIAKIVVWDVDRPAAIARAERALAETVVEGIPTTLEFARTLLRREEFRSGAYSTGTLAEVQAVAA